MSQPDPPNLDELARHVAEARSVRLGGGHNAGWIRAVTAGIDRQRLGQHFAAGVTDPAALDRLLDDTRTEPTQLQAVTTGPHPAIAAARRPECPTCHDNRIIETHGIASRCPDCATRIQETRTL